MSEKSHQHHVEEVSTYVKVFAALLVLLVLTYIAGKIDLDHFATGLNLAVAMLIAIVKATLVMLVFMHLKDSTRLTWICASAGFGWLLILLVLTLCDYATR